MNTNYLANRPEETFRSMTSHLPPRDWTDIHWPDISGSDPARWIDPLMKYQGLDYRVSLLRAAAFHGSSHQAAMIFQVIAPKQLRDIEIGRHRLQFLYQAPRAFSPGRPLLS